MNEKILDFKVTIKDFLSLSTRQNKEVYDQSVVNNNHYHMHQQSRFPLVFDTVRDIPHTSMLQCWNCTLSLNGRAPKMGLASVGSRLVRWGHFCTWTCGYTFDQIKCGGRNKDALNFGHFNLQGSFPVSTMPPTMRSPFECLLRYGTGTETDAEFQQYVNGLEEGFLSRG